MTSIEFEQLCVTIAHATDPIELFSIHGDSQEQRVASLNASHRALCQRLSLAAHDAGDDAHAAAAVMQQRLDELRVQALAQLSSGSSPSQGAQPSVILTSAGSYRVDAPLARGDLTMLYTATSIEGQPRGGDVVIKIAQHASDNTLLADEASALSRLHASAAPQRKHLPALLDRLMTPDGRAGNVLSHVEGVDLHALRRRYPDGLRAEHALWILTRLLSVLGHAHAQGIVHGNVEPAHVIVRPRDHNVTLIDWTSAVITTAAGGRFKFCNERFSAPEVRERRSPLPAADLYSAGLCFSYLLGAEPGSALVPAGTDERIARFIGYLTRQSAIQRAQDAWQTHHELSALRREVFGEPRFLELEMLASEAQPARFASWFSQVQLVTPRRVGSRTNGGTHHGRWKIRRGCGARRALDERGCVCGHGLPAERRWREHEGRPPSAQPQGDVSRVSQRDAHCRRHGRDPVTRR